jgi:hypothetical protein
MYFSTRHWARLVNGYSGSFPAAFIDLEKQMAAFPSPHALDALRAAGATHVTVNCRFYGSRCPDVLDAIEKARDRLRLVESGSWEGADVRLYEFR